MSPLVGYKEVSQVLGVKVATVYGYITHGLLPKNVYLGHGRFSMDKLEYHIERGTLFMKPTTQKKAQSILMESLDSPPTSSMEADDA